MKSQALRDNFATDHTVAPKHLKNNADKPIEETMQPKSKMDESDEVEKGLVAMIFEIVLLFSVLSVDNPHIHFALGLYIYYKVTVAKRRSTVQLTLTGCP